MAQKKRKVSAQTRVKLSQAAKRRRRGTKGTSLAGKFLAGARPVFQGMVGGSARSEFPPPPKGVSQNQSRLFDPESRAQKTWKEGDIPADKYSRAREGERKRQQAPKQAKYGFETPPKRKGKKGGPGGKRKPKNVPGVHGTTPSHVREVASQVRSDAQRQSHERLVDRVTYYGTKSATGVEDSEKLAAARREPSMTVRSDAAKDATKALREQKWKERGIYETKAKKTPSKFAKEEMAETHRQWFDQTDEFDKGVSKAGATRRRAQYVERLQEGDSHQEALNYALMSSGERRGRKPTGRATPGRAGTRKAPVRKSKFETVKPEAGEREIGVTARAVDKIDKLREDHPEATDRQLVRMQQEQRHDIREEMEKNLKWAHETRRSNIMGEKGNTDRLGSRKDKKEDDRVVFFTTSLGSPAPSVPADSLIGQYVIKRRKKMMEKAGVPKSQLRGEFPRAVRDMHMFEFSTGLSYGVKGEHGVFKETGWRRGSKASTGYNKPVPLGSHVLTDSQGTPLYDKDGRVMYSEGRTRQFNVQSPRAGLKIFIG